MTTIRSSALALTLGLVLTACGGSQPEAESAPPAPSAAPAPVEAPPAPSAAPAPAASESAAPPAASAEPPKKTPWKDMTTDQKKEVMKTVVYPAMKTAFQEFDSKRYADMTCMTCHGPGAKEGKFTMPNPKLPKLDPKDGFKKHKAKAETLKFMTEKVAPEMAKLLEVEPYNPETKQGFGCFNCHTMAGK